VYLAALLVSVWTNTLFGFRCDVGVCLRFSRQIEVVVASGFILSITAGPVTGLILIWRRFLDPEDKIWNKRKITIVLLAALICVGLLFIAHKTELFCDHVHSDVMICFL
jgi:hypothetical protein